MAKRADAGRHPRAQKPLMKDLMTKRMNRSQGNCYATFCRTVSCNMLQLCHCGSEKLQAAFNSSCSRTGIRLRQPISTDLQLCSPSVGCLGGIAVERRKSMELFILLGQAPLPESPFSEYEGLCTRVDDVFLLKNIGSGKLVKGEGAGHEANLPGLVSHLTSASTSCSPVMPWDGLMSKWKAGEGHWGGH